MPDFEKFAAENAQPRPKATINSFRSFGYSLNTAISDIVDNSISAQAKNIFIETNWNGEDSYISIKDDGVGMKYENLIQAMTPGSKDPNEHREKNDLGRFGLGLKSASFSQSKRLTVLTKTNNTALIKRCWDLDFVNEKQDWILLDFISDNDFIDNFKFDSGTLVLWEKLDRLIPNINSENLNNIKDDFYQKIGELKVHLELVFHKFLEDNRIKIFLNENELKGWNPFLKGKSSLITKEKISGIEIESYVLPHISKVDIDTRIELERLDCYNNQGFYLYRNERLINYGSWLGFFKNSEYSKLVRIYINFGNESDNLWSLDIKKSKAVPPLFIKKDLEVYARKAISESNQVFRYRGNKIKRNPDKLNLEFKPVWSTIKNDRSNSVNYKVNNEHTYIQSLLSQEVISIKDFKQVLRMVSDNIPIETIVHFQNQDSDYHELRENIKITQEIEGIAKNVFKHYHSQGFSHDKCIEYLLVTEPFNQIPEIIEIFN